MSAFRLASFRRRVTAAWVDGLVAVAFQLFGGFLGGVVFSALATSFNGTEGGLAQLSAESTEKYFFIGQFLGTFFWSFAFEVVNRWVLQGLTGATLGKHIFGIRVVHLDGSPIGVRTSIGRSVATLVSALPLYIGFLAPLWTKNRQTFHDSICGTLVIEKSSSLKVLPAPPRLELLDSGSSHDRKSA